MNVTYISQTFDYKAYNTENVVMYVKTQNIFGNKFCEKVSHKRLGNRIFIPLGPRTFHP